jgi:EmrB/QacA subfamily drug resistance transporter
VAGPASFGALREAIFGGRAPPATLGATQLQGYRWIVVGTVCIGAFMGQLDASIAQLLLPRLESDFAEPLSTVTWVALGYLLASATFLPIFGRLADMFGRKLMYVAGFVLFIVSSACCGFAPNLPTLIFFRLFQGASGALLGANSIAIVVNAAGPERRGRALGIQSAAQAVGLGAGPAFGGLVIDTLGWQWVFWINVPIGLVAAVMGWFVIPEDDPPTGHDRFDWKGALLIAPTLTALIILLNEGHRWRLVSPAIAGLTLLFLVSSMLWVYIEKRAPAPLVQLALFRRVAFSIGNAAGLLAYAALFGLFFLMPFLFIRAYGMPALEAGLRLSIVPVALGVMAPAGGAMSDCLGPRIASIGMLICVGSLALLFTALDSLQHLQLVMLSLALFGLGQGLFISPNNSGIMAVAPTEFSGEAGGVVNVARNIGISVGLAGASSLLSVRLQALTGIAGDTVHAPPLALLSAGRDTIILLGAFALVAGALSLAHRRPATVSQCAGASRRDQAGVDHSDHEEADDAKRERAETTAARMKASDRGRHRH